MARGELGEMLDEFPLGGVGVAEGDELAGFDLLGDLEVAHAARIVATADIGDAASGLDALIDKELLDGIDEGIIGDESASIGFDVDLVDFDLAGDFGPGFPKPDGIFHLLHHAHGDVDGDVELIVGGRRRSA